MSPKRKTPKPKAGNSRVQLRVQEFVKKLHPDVLRNQLRNFRKFVISTATEKRNSKDESIVPLPKECDSISSCKIIPLRSESNCAHSSNSQVIYEGACRNESTSYTESSYHGDHVTDEMDVNIIVSDVVAPGENSDVENVPKTETSSVNNLQLSIQTGTQPRNKSPITVQEWVDSLPLTPTESSRSHQLANKKLHEKKKVDECDVGESSSVPIVDTETDNLTLGAEAGHLCGSKLAGPASGPPIPPVNVTVTSCQEPSEVESHCSSVDSLLEARKPDPEEILLSLGFGGTASSSYLETGRIPKRFLKQSQLKGVDIEEFIKQQQDLIYTFESGYYGYRGLAGPSHSNPSVIVAKILEKLRDHERETASMTSYQLDFRKGCSLEKNNQEPTITNNNKFSKVARNVLTKIRCTPGSVLSPDNRRWLDSQGNKSPEIARRLILGQQSFTFGRDGDLIEASNSKNEKTGIDEEEETKKDQETSDLDATTISDCELLDDKLELAEEQNEHLHSADPPSYCDTCEDITVENSFNKNSNNRRLTDSSTDMSVESMIIRSDISNGRNRERTSSVNSEHSERPKGHSGNEIASRNSTLKRLNPVVNDEDEDEDIEYSIGNINLSKDSKTESAADINESRILSLEVDQSLDITTSVEELHVVIPVHETTDECSENGSSKELLSLRDELKDSGVLLHLDNDFNSEQSSIKKLKNVLTRYSSFEESIKESSDEEVNVVCSSSRSLSEYQCSEKTDQCSDSATESEFASYANRSLFSKNIHRQYEELILLESKLQSLGRPLKVISEDQFSAISSEQRCALQSQIIREALKVYLNQLTEDEMHLELKNCLSTEAQKVADLLDSSSDTSNLSIIVRQMTLLLQHQSQLSAQIKELSIVNKKPSSCHEMCDHILKRVHELEMLVQENAQELAQMKYQLLSKNNS